MNIANIKISGMRQPICLDDKNPIVTWEIHMDNQAETQRNITQQSYKIWVCRNKETIWESGVRREATQICALSPIELLPCTEYQVFIELLLSNGKRLKGESSWRTGYLSQKSWRGSWIGPDRKKRQSVHYEEALAQIHQANDEEEISGSIQDLYPVTCFQKELPGFSKQIVQAMAYVTARGMYELEIGGEKVGNMELTPEFTPYHKYLQYQAYDVTDILNKKCGKISVILADGYYIGRIGMVGTGYEYGDYLSFLFEMEITFEDGSKETIVSDETWRYTETEIRYSDLFIGEKWDMTYQREAAGRIPIIRKEDYSVLRGQASDAACILQTVPAKQIFVTPKGETVIDFGQVLCGRACIKIHGKEGETIVLDHQETLDENGNFFFNIPKFNCEQRDIFITSSGECELMPKFAYHGFRYVRISGYSGAIEPEQCSAVVIGSPCEKTLEFSCSDSRLNQLQHNIWWSQQSNFCGIPTDCPQRERAGWTGDIQIYAETACMNADIRAFLKRWLEEMRLEQTPSGEIPIVVPFNKGYREMQQQYGGAAGSAGWGDACVIVPWKLYMAYGDQSVLADNFAMMEQWENYVRRQAELPADSEKGTDQEEKEYQKYLWNSGFHFGDWLYPSARNEEGVSDAFLSALTSKDLVAPTMYAYSVHTMIQVCEALGKRDRSIYYQELLKKIKEAYAFVYIKEDGRILPELQGIYVLALKMGLVPEDRKAKTVEHLVRLIRENRYCLDTGFLSVPFLLDVLYENGKSDLAYRLLYNERCPSWLYEVKMGATTIWESWDAVSEAGVPTVTSFNHYAFGCVGSWIYRVILGLSPIYPGYKKFKICPDFNCGLESAEGTFHSIYGDIKIHWEKIGNMVNVETEIPVNTTAEICLSYNERTIKKTIGSGQYTYKL